MKGLFLSLLALIVTSSAQAQSAKEAFNQAIARKNAEVQAETNAQKEIYHNLKALYYLEKEEILLNKERELLSRKGNTVIIKLKSDLLEWETWTEPKIKKNENGSITRLSASKTGYTTTTNNDYCQVSLTYHYSNTGVGDYSLDLILKGVCMIEPNRISFSEFADLRSYMTLGPDGPIQEASVKKALKQFINKHPKNALINTVPHFVFID